MSTKLISKVNRCLKYIQFSLLPGTCILCQKPSKRDEDLCQACEVLLPGIPAPCESCALPLALNAYDGQLCGNCVVNPPPCKYIVAAFAYAEPLRQLIGSFKYHGKLAYGRALSQQLLKRLLVFYEQREMPGLLIPMPLHPERLHHRGFNQAVEIGQFLSHQLGIPLERHLCIRHRNTPRQEGLNVKARARNLHNAFSWQGNNAALPDTVAIIDDVVTTMASTHALASLLRQNNIKEVHVWSLARACKKR